MATPKLFKSLLQLERGKRRAFVVPGNRKLPSWCHSEYLESPKAVRLEAWLVEVVFGKDGEHIPHVECVTHTLLRVNRWNPEGEAEILIFGRPYYQQDVSEMIGRLADHFRQQLVPSTEPRSPGGTGLPREANLALLGNPGPYPQGHRGVLPTLLFSYSDKALAQEVENQQSLVKVQEAPTQQPPIQIREAPTQESPLGVPEAPTRQPPVEICESSSSKLPEAVPKVETRPSSVEVHETGTQQSLDLVQDARIQEPSGAPWDLVTRL